MILYHLHEKSDGDKNEYSRVGLASGAGGGSYLFTAEEGLLIAAMFLLICPKNFFEKLSGTSRHTL